MDYEAYDTLLYSLDNIKLLKLAHDMGCKVENFPSPYVDPYYGMMGADDIFFQAVNQLFEVVEVYSSYSDPVETEEKRYWLDLAGFDTVDENLEILLVFVILDDCIDTSGNPGIIEVYGDWYEGYAEIGFIESGLVIWADVDNGIINWASLMEKIKDFTKK